MIGFDDAVAIVAAAATPLASERVTIGEAHRRTLAKALCAGTSAPRCDVATMDGYAVRDADLRAVPARLRVAGESFAGRRHAGSVGAGACVRIFTGAPVPAGADRVVMQEIVRREGGSAVVETLPGPHRYIRAGGSDFGEGDLLLRAGRLLDHRALVAAAAAGGASVEVWRQPRMALLATGDELAEAGTARRAAEQIPESASFGVLALARDWGAEPVARLLSAPSAARLRRWWPNPMGSAARDVHVPRHRGRFHTDPESVSARLALE